MTANFTFTSVSFSALGFLNQGNHHLVLPAYHPHPKVRKAPKRAFLLANFERPEGIGWGATGLHREGGSLDLIRNPRDD
jgi:hypothetical protein